MNIVIVGTGISALLLAQSLIRRGAYDRLLLIGPRRPPRAHRLAYWSREPTPFDGHADASWSNLRITEPSAHHIAVPLSKAVYRTFSARAWVADTLSQVVAAPRVSWLERSVEAVTPIGEEAAIVQSGGESVRADWVFTSGMLRARPDCWQRFLGWEVELPNEQPDTQLATLMDFRTAPERDFRFMYRLPLAPRRLFVEHVSYQPCDHAAQLHDYLTKVLQLSDYRIVEREAGATPLYRDRPPRRHGRVVDIGVAGGLAKATTGYAVTRMWRDAERIAEQLAGPGELKLEARLPLLYRLADHFFLELLARAPAQLPRLMSALFSRARGDAVLAFLDDRARLGEKLAVALSMPGWLRWWLWGRI